MKKGIIIICFVFISSVSFGQEKLNSIILTPLNFIDPVNPSIQLGYSRKINEKWELQFEGAILIKKSIWDELFEDEFDFEDSMKVFHKGFRLRGELKYYLTQDVNSWIQYYISSEFFYLRNNTKTTEMFYPKEGSWYYDFFTNKKQKYGLNIKYGVKIFLDNQFLLEPHVGLGVSFREIRHEGRENLDDNLDNLIGLNSNKVIGNRWVINLPINIKIGYRF